MPRIIGNFYLKVRSANASVEDVRSLLQVIRNWERERHAEIVVGVDAPGITKEEAHFVLRDINPPFDHQVFGRLRLLS